MICSTLKAIFAENGYEVHNFSNPAMCPLYHFAALDCLLDHPCSDIIISDINMSFENGLEFIENLLKKGCKVIFQALMSAEWTKIDLHYAEKIGCRVFHKPFNLDEMLKWLSNCRKHIDLKRVLSDWPMKVKTGW